MGITKGHPLAHRAASPAGKKVYATPSRKQTAQSSSWGISIGRNSLGIHSS